MTEFIVRGQQGMVPRSDSPSDHGLRTTSSSRAPRPNRSGTLGQPTGLFVAPRLFEQRAQVFKCRRKAGMRVSENRFSYRHRAAVQGFGFGIPLFRMVEKSEAVQGLGDVGMILAECVLTNLQCLFKS